MEHSPLTISFDIGIKNLAYCLFYPIDASQERIQIIDWRIINLLDTEEKKESHCQCNTLVYPNKKSPKLCGKKAIYQHTTENYYCGVHAKTSNKHIPSKENSLASFKKLKVDDLRERMSHFGISYQSNTKQSMLESVEKWLAKNMLQPVIEPVKKNAKKTHLVELGTAMKQKFREYLGDYMYRINTVLLENQISPIAGRMNTIQGLVAQTFIMMKQDGEPINIEFVSSSGKLKKYKTGNTENQENQEVLESLETPELSLQQKQNQNYKQHKKDSIRITQEKLTTNEEMSIWRETFDKSPKKDDLADCYLQALYFIR